MNKKNNKRGRKKKTKPYLSIYRIAHDIFQIRITFNGLAYTETVYYNLTELAEFLRLTLRSQETQIPKILRSLSKSKYYVYEYQR